MNLIAEVFELDGDDKKALQNLLDRSVLLADDIQKKSESASIAHGTDKIGAFRHSIFQCEVSVNPIYAYAEDIDECNQQARRLADRKSESPLKEKLDEISHTGSLKIDADKERQARMHIIQQMRFALLNLLDGVQALKEVSFSNQGQAEGIQGSVKKLIGCLKMILILIDETVIHDEHFAQSINEASEFLVQPENLQHEHEDIIKLEERFDQLDVEIPSFIHTADD